MKKVLLVSENYMRENLLISDNLQGKYLQSAIRNAQIKNYQSVVGTAMYEKLQTLVEDGTISDESNKAYKDLLDNSQLYIAYTALVELCVITNVKVANMGMVQTNDENVSVLNINDMFKMRDEYQKMADHLLLLLQNYILENENDLPEIDDTNIYNIKSNLYSSASCALNLGGPRGKGGYTRDIRHRGWDKD